MSKKKSTAFIDDRSQEDAVRPGKKNIHTLLEAVIKIDKLVKTLKAGKKSPKLTARNIERAQIHGLKLLAQPVSGIQQTSNILAGTKALARARDAFVRPGVRLALGKEIPKYQVDPDYPEHLIRLQHGRKTVGTMKSGKFQAIK